MWGARLIAMVSFYGLIEKIVVFIPEYSARGGADCAIWTATGMLLWGGRRDVRGARRTFGLLDIGDRPSSPWLADEPLIGLTWGRVLVL